MLNKAVGFFTVFPYVRNTLMRIPFSLVFNFHSSKIELNCDMLLMKSCDYTKLFENHFAISKVLLTLLVLKIFLGRLTCKLI